MERDSDLFRIPELLVDHLTLGDVFRLRLAMGRTHSFRRLSRMRLCSRLGLTRKEGCLFGETKSQDGTNLVQVYGVRGNHGLPSSRVCGMFERSRWVQVHDTARACTSSLSNALSEAQTERYDAAHLEPQDRQGCQNRK